MEQVADIPRNNEVDVPSMDMELNVHTADTEDEVPCVDTEVDVPNVDKELGRSTLRPKAKCISTCQSI